MPASALVRRVFIGLLVANLAVVGVKLAVGLTSGSLAVLGGAVDSCVDALNNVLALIIVRVAAKEPDEDHPYGHGKFETLGALAIVGFLSITCFELVRGAVNHFVSGSHRVDVSDFQLALLVLTLGMNLLITWYEHRRGIELGSELLVADAAHTRADVFITVGILVGILLTRQGWWWSGTSATCGCTKSRFTSSHAEPRGGAALPDHAAATALAQAGVPGVPAAAHRGIQERAHAGRPAGDRRRGGTRARGERRRAVPPHRSAAARACRPHHRPTPATPFVPALAPEASRAARGAARPHALGPRIGWPARQRGAPPRARRPGARGRRRRASRRAVHCRARRRGVPRRSRPRVRRRRGEPGRHGAARGAVPGPPGHVPPPGSRRGAEPGDHRSHGARAGARARPSRTAHRAAGAHSSRRRSRGPPEPHGERGHPTRPRGAAGPIRRLGNRPPPSR